MDASRQGGRWRGKVTRALARSGPSPTPQALEEALRGKPAAREPSAGQNHGRLQGASDYPLPLIIIPVAQTSDSFLGEGCNLFSVSPLGDAGAFRDSRLSQFANRQFARGEYD